MSHRSRGCLRCRQRRVKCDRGRPSCQRCIARSELCVGYRDEADLLFQDETTKVKLKSQSASSAPSSTPSTATRRTRSRSVERLPSEPSSLKVDTSPLRIKPALPWLKAAASEKLPSFEDQAATCFMDKYVMYPCNSSSAPGFLEHLPGLFKDVNVEGRYALRWAVQAAAFADLSRENSSEELASRALECYGRALGALGESLSEKGKTPDDYDLMTVVVLDIFESLFLPESTPIGTHAQGMAHILRLRGHDQFYDARGWGLFRLAHHRLQKQQLAYRLSPLPESNEWLDSLSDDVSFVRLEKDSLEISTECQKANQLLESLNTDGPIEDLPIESVLDQIDTLAALSDQGLRRRSDSRWSFKKIKRENIEGNEDMISEFPDKIELHPDVWMAYEWNYARTGRIILHQRLIECLLKFESISAAKWAPVSEAKLSWFKARSQAEIVKLADGVLSTVPQTFGDIDHMGRCVPVGSSPPRCQAIGAYLILWPIKIIKSPKGYTRLDQKERAQKVFERIRECTGMKSNLGNLSLI